MFLIGVSSASMDTVSHHYTSSVFASIDNDHFFDPAYSWRNKYKDGDPTKGPAFMFSTTWLSWTTDFWHLAKFMLLNFVTLLGVSTIRGAKIWMYVVAFVALRAAFQIGFTLFYDYLFI